MSDAGEGNHSEARARFAPEPVPLADSLGFGALLGFAFAAATGSTGHEIHSDGLIKASPAFKSREFTSRGT